MLNIFSPLILNQQKYPLFSSKISAGFPSPADDYIEEALDLNQLLIKHPVATFFVRAAGNALDHIGIHDQDILIIDRSLSPRNGQMIIAAVEGQLAIKRFQKINNKIYLHSENSATTIEMQEENEIYLWGVITTIIHNTL